MQRYNISISMPKITGRSKCTLYHSDTFSYKQVIAENLQARDKTD